MILSGSNTEEPLGSLAALFRQLQTSWMTPVRHSSFRITKADLPNARIHG